MFRKEVNERSPMRVFEKSIHGGLGTGNLGVVVARAGVGKTPLLVQIALDDLMRGRRVLHISHEHAVDHVRAYYDELFYDMAATTKLERPDEVHMFVERHRLIYSHLSSTQATPPSMRGGSSSIDKIRQTIQFAKDTAHFEPDVIIVDGFDFEHANDSGVRALRELAEVRSVELWASVKTDTPAKDITAIPDPIARFKDQISVVVLLEPAAAHVGLRLLKDHDNKQLADLSLRLDVHSMRVVDEDVPPMSDRRSREPRRFKLHSGGARGAESAFGGCAERWGMNEVNYSFSGHRLLERRRGVRVLSDNELSVGDFSLVFASRRLGRVLSDIPLVRNVLQTIWHQVSAAQQVFVVGTIQEDGTVRGGTGWGAELARLWKKQLFVFDQDKNSWFLWSGTTWEPNDGPVIGAENFCGTGTQNITDGGREAVRALFERSFGPAKSG